VNLQIPLRTAGTAPGHRRHPRRLPDERFKRDTPVTVFVTRQPENVNQLSRLEILQQHTVAVAEPNRIAMSASLRGHLRERHDLNRVNTESFAK